MILGIKEGFAVLKKLNIKPKPKKLLFFNLPTWLLTICSKLLLGTKLAETTMVKHCIVAKSEMILLQSEFDVLIKKSRLATPNIDSLKVNLNAGK